MFVCRVFWGLHVFRDCCINTQPADRVIGARKKHAQHRTPLLSPIILHSGCRLGVYLLIRVNYRGRVRIKGGWVVGAVHTSVYDLPTFYLY
jgi:hypothetical protein